MNVVVGGCGPLREKEEMPIGITLLAARSRFFSSLHGMFFFVYHRMMLMSTFISTFFIFIINNR